MGCLLWLGVILSGCGGSSGSSPDPGPSPDPDPGPDPEVTMEEGEVYPVSADDRLVNTSPEAARIQVRFELDEEAGTTSAEVVLLEGHADLFQ